MTQGAHGAAPTLHMICGLPCAGKTTLAKRIEQDRSAVRLTPDEWLVRLLPAGYTSDDLDAARDPIESVLWDLAVRLLTLGVDVIIDFGFWSREEREGFRSRAAALGARTDLHFCDASLDVLLSRLAARNADLPAGTFWIDPERVKGWYEIFEAPTADELVAREVAT